ncbi:unnamed protein product [Sphagnum jensenii]
MGTTVLVHSCVSVCALHRSSLPSRRWESCVISGGEASRSRRQRLFTVKAAGVSDFSGVLSRIQSEHFVCSLTVVQHNDLQRRKLLLGDSQIVSTSSNAPLPQRITQFAEAFWRFVRPHTIRGTFLGATALVVRALIENPALIDWSLLPKALRGLLALLCGNGYIVGINQIYDVGIDKVNKPFLPIASGDLSIPAAWVLVLGLAIVGISIVATNFGPLITCLYSFGLFLGGIYSVPPLRLKQHAVPAFLIIATVRGFLLNFGVYYATRAALGLRFIWNPSIVFITGFVTVFATVIAITKDLADIEGDKKYKISTFATKLGVRNISFLGAGLLLLNYIGAIFAGLYLRGIFQTQVMVPAHAILGIGLVYQTWLLDAEKYSKDAIAGFYRFVWYLFYSEYILLPFM